MNILEEVQEKAEKTVGELNHNKRLLKKLTAMAIHPNSRKFDATYIHDMFAAIGKASVNIMLLTDLHAHQISNIKAIKRNEFFLCPLITLIKIIKFITGRK